MVWRGGFGMDRNAVEKIGMWGEVASGFNLSRIE